MENNTTDYSDFIDDEVVRMQMDDFEKTVQLHEKAFFGKPQGRRYDNYDFENSQVMKNFRESKELERKHRKNSFKSRKRRFWLLETVYH